MEFRKTVKLEISDYTAFNFFVLKRVFILLPIICVGLSYLLIYRGDPDRSLLSFAVYAVVISILALLGFFLLMRHSMKKSFKTTKAMQLPQEVVLDDAGVHASGEFGNTNMSWQDLYRVVEVKKAFYVYLLKMQAVIIPKRLTSADENAVIRSIVKKYLAPNKYRFKKQ